MFTNITEEANFWVEENNNVLLWETTLSFICLNKVKVIRMYKPTFMFMSVQKSYTAGADISREICYLRLLLLVTNKRKEALNKEQLKIKGLCD